MIRRLLTLWKLRYYDPLCRRPWLCQRELSSDVPLDIVQVTASKDAEMLEQSLLSVKKHLRHPLGMFFIVSPEDAALRAIAEKHGALFRDEREVFGFGKEKTPYRFKDQDRSGWLFQQLLKLNADSFVNTEHYLVLDADTVFLKPRVFLFEGKTIFDHSNEHHAAYYRTYRKLFGQPVRSPVSFVAHCMLFQKSVLAEMKRILEARHGKIWYEAILDACDYDDISGFSEYETYGNFFLANHPDRYLGEYWFNFAHHELTENCPPEARSLSVHSYRKKS